jgi:4'-phosphopantetheinyl transferase EntD
MGDEIHRSLFAPLLAPGIAVVESVDKTPAPLFPEEAAVVSRAVEKRRREFALGRECARRALASLGVPAAPLLPGKNRVPVWPQAIVGSITHCDGYCAAAVGPVASFSAIGIDAEVHRPLSASIIKMIARPEERLDLQTLPRNGINWECVLFSAKEAVFKAWYPLTNTWLEFSDVSLRIAPATRSFRAELLVSCAAVDNRALSTFEGRFAVTPRFVATGTFVPAVAAD